MLLKACLNGAHPVDAHPALPITPDELTRDAAAAVLAGAGAIHVHPRRPDGREGLEAETVGATVAAVREAARVPVGVTTGAWILAEPEDRLAAVTTWTELPDFASVNLHEAGAVAVAQCLLDRGVGVEAGLWDADAARTLVDSGLAARCVRLLYEPMDARVEDALGTVAAMDEVLGGAAPDVPRLLHGMGPTVWALVDEAARRGWQTRIGLEDTLVHADGRPAEGNTDLVAAARLRLDAGRDRAHSSP